MMGSGLESVGRGGREKVQHPGLRCDVQQVMNSHSGLR